MEPRTSSTQGYMTKKRSFGVISENTNLIRFKNERKQSQETPEDQIKVPETIKWKDVTLPESWKYPVKTIPSIPLQENKEVDYIIQTEDGSVELKYKRSNSFRHFHKRLKLPLNDWCIDHWYGL